MEIQDKQFQIGEIASTNALRCELGKFEEWEGGQYDQGEFRNHYLAFMEKKRFQKRRRVHL